MIVQTKNGDSRTPRLLRLAAVGAAGAGLLLVLAGCQGHGKYTTEGINAANQRQSQLIAGSSWDMAHQAYLAGDLDKAMEKLENSLLLRPNVPKSHVLKGRILLEQANFEAAIKSFERAAEIVANAEESEREKYKDEAIDAAYFQGVIYERIAKPERALEHYRKASELDPEDPQHVVAVAEVLIDLGRTEEAQAFLRDTADTFEHNPGVRQTLGHLAQMRGELVKATEYFQEAHLLAPDQPSILEDLVRAQMEAGRFAEAEYNLSRLMENPEAAKRRDLQRLQAECAMALDRPVEARSILLELTSGPAGRADVESWIQLGIVSLALDDTARLRTAASRVTAIDPKRFEGHLLRALFWRSQGREEDALAALDLAVEHRGEDVSPLLLRAGMLHERGEVEPARRDLRRALVDEPSHRQARRMLAALPEGAEPTVAGVPESR